MAPATRTIASTSTNDEPVTRQYVGDALAQIRQMITGLGAQNNLGARQASQYSRLAKVEFPKFYGEDLIKSKGENFSWTEYKEAITLRFGLVYDDPMAALKNGKYDKSAKEDQDTFDNLLCRVEVSEEHVGSLYLGGMPTELEMSVRMFKRKTLTDAYCLTTLQEDTLEAVKKKSRPFVNQTNRRFRVHLTQKEYEEKRSKNLCFYCDKKYMPGHKCTGQLYSLVVLADNEEEEETFMDVDDTLVDITHEEVQPQISLNALSGVSYFQTMRVIGLVAKGHKLHILVDSGSTHNFLDVNMAKRLGCKIWSTCPLRVSIVGGSEIVTVGECKDFQWRLYGQTFITGVMFLPLRGCDMVLGIQWLSTLGDIKWNFQQLKMEFLYNNNKVCLRGTNKTVTHWLDARKQIEKLDTTGQAELIMMTIYPNTGLQLMTTEESMQAKVKVEPSLQKVIDAYAELFEVPNKLLPTRSHDYRITLMLGTQPVNISYYRHPLVQKDAIKAMIKELLKSGVIKH
ncbi:gypsy/ty3 retroelement polyprotein, partial [Tanacetum coccineum]